MVMMSMPSGAKRSLAVILALAVAIGGCGGIAVGGNDALPPEKRAMESFAASFRAAAPEGTKEPGATPGVPLQTDAPPPLGLFEGPTVDAPVSGSVFQPYNAWAGIRDGSYIVVYAGFRDGDRTKGAVFLTIRPMAGKVADPNGLTIQFISAPAAAGALRIVREIHGLVTLVGETGMVVELDVDRRSLVGR